MTVDEYIQKLTLEEKAALLQGWSTWTTREVKRLGIPAIFLSDGPHGLRKQAGTGDHLGLNASIPSTCFPTAATMANSWDTELGEELGRALGEEAAANDVNMVLGPGLNMKRSPLCGRNFEYYSEDPILAGRTAAAVTRGVQSKPGCGVTIKHFACNNQEDNRMGVDCRVSPRALREIYLLGFEIAVRNAAPKAIMTSYNVLNGVHTPNRRDLCTTVPREEWGFDGIIMTDWATTTPDGGSSPWMCAEVGNDLIMPGLPCDTEDIRKAVQSGQLSEEAVRSCAGRLIDLIAEFSK